MFSSVGLLLASMELRAAGISGQTLLHIWDTAFQGLFMALVMLFGAFTHGVWFRAYSLATLVTALVFGALYALILLGVAAGVWLVGLWYFSRRDIPAT